MPSEIRPIIPNVAIPPNIPPGPKAANAVVIAAPPVSPVAPIAVTNTRPGIPKAAIFDTNLSIYISFHFSSFLNLSYFKSNCLLLPAARLTQLSHSR